MILMGDGAIDDIEVFEIVAEGVTVAVTNELLKAVCCLISVHYVFNMAYGKGTTPTLTFIQKVLMNLQDKEKTPKSVLTLLDRVNAKLPE